MNEQGPNERQDGRRSRRQAISASDCGRPQPPNDASARSFARLAPPAPIKAAENAVEATPAAAGDFVASIREAIETLSCGEDYPTIRTTAEYVGMSVRTLQRRLAQAGSSHHVLIAQARFATAAVVLERTDAKILELALNLGYSDHANFTRAFRRWAGCPPREYRSNNTRHEDVRTLGYPEEQASERQRPLVRSAMSPTQAAHDDTRPGPNAE